MDFAGTSCCFIGDIGSVLLASAEPGRDPTNEFGTERRFAANVGRSRFEGRPEEADSPVRLRRRASTSGPSVLELTFAFAEGPKSAVLPAGTAPWPAHFWTVITTFW